MSLFDLASRIARPALFSLSPERAHQVMMQAMKAGVVPSINTHIDERLNVNVGGIEFPNPLGLAAGCDKNAKAPDAFLKLGFGYAEIGTLTPRGQGGNPKPRIFRLTQDEAVINRLGFNNNGHHEALLRLEQRASKGGIVGVNIGANKDSEDFVADYEKGLETFYDVASYFTMNISSPNTPGLRNLQMGAALETMLERAFIVAEKQAQRAQKTIPIFLKIAPDLDDTQMDEIASVINASKLDGVIISNTTLDRDGLSDTKQAGEAGGLSGKPLFKKSTLVLAKMRKKLNPTLPIIGVGGVSSSKDVITKMEAGADLVQLYTGLVFGGPCLPSKIIRELLQHLDTNKLENISQITGSKTDAWIEKLGVKLMQEITIWHNPRCSKSRQTLELLQANGCEPEVVEYLKTPPEVTQILQALVKLKISAHDLMRTGEATYKELGLSKDSDDKVLVKAMHENPILIERPVVISGDRAIIGRPPEAVLELID